MFIQQKNIMFFCRQPFASLWGEVILRTFVKNNFSIKTWMWECVFFFHKNYSGIVIPLKCKTHFKKMLIKKQRLTLWLCRNNFWMRFSAFGLVKLPTGQVSVTETWRNVIVDDFVFLCTKEWFSRQCSAGKLCIFEMLILSSCRVFTSLKYEYYTGIIQLCS